MFKGEFKKKRDFVTLMELSIRRVCGFAHVKTIYISDFNLMSVFYSNSLRTI
jgi:hypothetical protein